MLRTLLESNAPRQRRRGGTVTSVAVHTLLIGGAVFATASAKTEGGPTTSAPSDTVIFISPSRQPETPREHATSRKSSGGAPHEPPRLPRWTIEIDPNRIDVGPPIDIDLRRLAGADSIPRGSVAGPFAPAGGERAGAGAGEPATAATVDRPAALIAPPRPRYPDQLRAAGVVGRVVVRLVVDTTGRVEASSVAIRESSHDLFTLSVRAVLPALRFTPAEVGGRKVRMLVELPFEFRLDG